MSDSPSHAARLEHVVRLAEPALLAISQVDAARPWQPGKWSAKQIIGHLIDSASNNHQRFVRATWQDDLVFSGYRQDAWVDLQGYQGASWPELVTLWGAFNLHLARVMAAIPESVRTRRHQRHNLHEVAWRPVAPSEPTTLDYFMSDYVGHLEHHLRQVLGDDWLIRAKAQT